jgi:hypothetical protein
MIIFVFFNFFPFWPFPWQRRGSFWGLEKIQNGGCCHGKQGTEWPPNTKILPIRAKFGFQVDYDVAN